MSRPGPGSLLGSGPTYTPLRELCSIHSIHGPQATDLYVHKFSIFLFELTSLSVYLNSMSEPVDGSEY